MQLVQPIFCFYGTVTWLALGNFPDLATPVAKGNSIF